jgi:hypothetical protein
MHEEADIRMSKNIRNITFFVYIYEVTFCFISLWLHEHLRVNKYTWTLMLCHCDPRYVYDFVISDSRRPKYPMSFFFGLNVLCGVCVCVCVCMCICVRVTYSIFTCEFCFVAQASLYRVIPSVLDQKKFEYLKDYSLDCE